MNVDFGDALNYPVRGEEVAKTHLIGGGSAFAVNLVVTFIGFLSIFFPPIGLLNLFVLPFQIAIAILWAGYFIRIARSTYAGMTDPPTFGDWGQIARDGLWGFVIGLIYQIPAIVLTVIAYGILAVMILGIGVAGSGDSEAGIAAASLLGIVLFLVALLATLVYTVVMAYLLPISLCAFAAEGSLRGAFSLDRLKRVGLSSDYAVPWLLFAVIYGVIVGIVWFLTIILIGYLLVPFLPLVYFYLGMAAFYLFAQVYADEIGVEAEPPTA